MIWILMNFKVEDHKYFIIIKAVSKNVELCSFFKNKSFLLSVA